MLDAEAMLLAGFWTVGELTAGAVAWDAGGLVAGTLEVFGAEVPLLELLFALGCGFFVPLWAAGPGLLAGGAGD